MIISHTKSLLSEPMWRCVSIDVPRAWVTCGFIEQTGHEMRPASLFYVFVLDLICSLASTVRKAKKVLKLVLNS